MTGPTINLSPEVRLPLAAVGKKFAFMGISGSGKTYGAGRFAEQLIEVGAQTVIVDGVGVWWALRVAADGKSPGYPIYVFGGQHGDIPLDSGAGELLANILVDQCVSAVLDTSEFTVAEQRKFVTAFATHLFHRKKTVPQRTAMMVIWEECQDFIPQKGGPETARMVGAMERLIKQGRNHGVGTTLISQRPQAVNKDVLNQTEVLCCFQLVGKHERKAVREWMEEQNVDQAALDELPSLPNGTCFFWSPAWLRTFQRIRVSPKTTFDASATPELGHEPRRFDGTIAKLDLEKISSAMSNLLDERAQNDPAALRERIRQLEQALARRPSERPVQVPVLSEETTENLQGLVQRYELVGNDIGLALASMRRQFEQAVRILPGAPPVLDATQLFERPGHSESFQKKVTSLATHGSLKLELGAREMLKILATFHPKTVSKTVIATLAGYSPKGGGFQNYLGKLRTLGLMVKVLDEYQATPEGMKVAREYFTTIPKPKTTGELVDLWTAKLQGKAKDILRSLVSLGPRSQGMTKDEIAAGVEMDASGGGFQNYLGHLRSNGLIEKQGGRYVPSRSFFP